MYETTYITSQGEILAAKTLQSKLLKFSKFSVGSGEIAEPSSDNIKALQSLINPILDFDITKISRDTDTQVTVRGLFKNTDLEESFYLRELGLYAIDPDTQKEILFAYINFGDKAEYINNSISEKKEIYYNMVITVDNADNVSITIDSTTIYVTEKQFEEEMINSGVVVSPTEPTGSDRKKVWIQKGKNLFNTNGLKSQTSLGITVSFNNSELKLNGASTGAGELCNQATQIKLPKGTYTLSSTFKSGSITRDTQQCALYLRERGTTTDIAYISLAHSDVRQASFTLTKETLMDVFIYVNAEGFEYSNVVYAFQLETGSAATEYKAYAVPVMYLKNDNGEYEEFIKKLGKTGDISNADESVFEITSKQVIQQDGFVHIHLRLKLLKDIAKSAQYTFQLSGVDFPLQTLYEIGNYGNQSFYIDSLLYAFIGTSGNLVLKNDASDSLAGGRWEVDITYCVI